VAAELLTAHVDAVYAVAQRVYDTERCRVLSWSQLTAAQRAALLPEAHLLSFDDDPEQDSAGLLAWLERLSAEVKRGSWKPGEHGQVAAFGVGAHLYAPLLEARPGARLIHLTGKPVPLDAHERRFVEDVQAYAASVPSALQGATVHLLRNEANRGGQPGDGAARIGFSAGGDRYFPDFMLWIVRDGRQHLVFVDTKGLVHLGDEAGRDKVELHRTLRRLEDQWEGGPALHLDAWIVSSTPFTEAPQPWSDIERAHADRITFPSPDRRGDLAHIDRIVRSTLAWAEIEYDPSSAELDPSVRVGRARLRGSSIPVADAGGASGLTDRQRAAAEAWKELHPGLVRGSRRP
jgi:hypothetical protein